MPSPIDHQATMFDTCAELYARHRPVYPDAAIETLITTLPLEPGALLCDLGAGPGILSFLLAARGFRVAAVEPVEGMRKQGARITQERRLAVDYIAGVAEAIPLQDASVEAVVCGQAFHWFQANQALREIHRILKSHGGLALLWNNKDWQQTAWLGEIERLIVKYNPKYDPNYRTKRWDEIINHTQLFHPAERFDYSFELHPTPDDVMGLTRSYSYVRMIPSETQPLLLQEVLSVLDREWQVHHHLLLRYRTELYVARKLP